MKYRKLGKTGLSVSEIGFGTGQLGGVSLIGGRHIGAPEVDKSEAVKILRSCYEAGVNFYDTSDKYGDGKAERLLGEVFRADRSKVIIATKCGITETGERCFESEYVRSRLDRSLKNLNTDYVDIFQLTKPNISLIESGSIYETFDELKREGKIRFAGVSTGTEEETLKLISDNRIDALQIFYNLLYVSPNDAFIDKAFDKGIGLIVRSPMSSGMLTGKFNYSTTFSKEDERSLYLHGETLKSRVDMVYKIVKELNLPKVSDIMLVSLNYLLSNDKISTIIPAVSKASQLPGILQVCFAERMTKNEFDRLENFVKGDLKS